MSLENDDPHSPDQPTETNPEMQKKLKISYTREFLLSFSELDICKKLPSGFDQSIISEFEDAFKDRQRVSSGLLSHGFRRNEHGSSPPTRGEVAGYSRTIQGRWEGRSTGRGDKDNDSQSDKDSDSGRHLVNQSRRPWQVPEHDGLLGSGSFPRPAGFSAGISAPKARPNDLYQLNRTNEPYHPPRPYKATPHSRRETTDSLNDETFGSSEFTSEDRAEEERKRRASFESMRKEQHKEFQEKSKLKPEKNKGDFDFSMLMDGSKDEKELMHRSSEMEKPLIPPASNNDAEKSTFHLQTPASRPRVPPGFASTVLERNLGAKSLSHPHEVEVVNSELEENVLHAKSKLVLNGTSDSQVEKQSAEQMALGKQKHGSASTHALVDGLSEKNLSLSPPRGAYPQGSYNKIIGTDSHLHNVASASHASSRNNEVVEHNAEKVMGNKIVGESNQGHSIPTSILEKLFSSAVASDGAGSSNIPEHHDSRADETSIPDAAESSKFVRWFHEEEKKPGDDLSSGRRNDLLSLIVGGEKGGSHISDEKKRDHSFPSFSSQNSEPADRFMPSDIVSPTVVNSEQSFKTNKSKVVSAVLTCEDLEQSILSEISESGPSLQPPVQRWAVPDRKPEPVKANVDNHASHHLLSLLQKGTSSKDMGPSSTLETTSSGKLHGVEETAIGTAVHSSKEEDAENVSDSGKSLTLETLFGTAFMKELQSVGAPVSVKRGPAGTARVDVMEPHGSPFPVNENSLLATAQSSAIEIGPNAAGLSSSDLTVNRRRQTKPDRIEERWLGFDNPQIERGSSQDLGSKIGIFDGPADFRLPEEDSLIAVSEPLNIQNFMSSGSPAKSKLFSSQNTQVDIVEKLAAMNSAFKDERAIMGSQEGPPFLHGPFDMREPDVPYQNLNLHPSSQQLHHPQGNHAGGPLFHPLDSRSANINSQMNFMAPEGTIRSDPPPNHQFHGNMLRPPFHHANARQPGFDAQSHHPMLQQMHIPGNFPPPHLLRGLSSAPPHGNRNATLPAHPNSHATNFMQELNPMQGFPFGPRQPNFGGHGMPSPAPVVAGGSNHPEAIQRLIEMELRANPKQIRPFAGGGHGHELDMGFGYR